ncbi:MAG: TetR/AcrR family transcriptional regulator [Nocardioides sp.]|nr:TetR/AcrR family transcriptional regulator [Nocardioides sp.]
MASTRSYGGQSADERVAARRARLVEATITLLAEQGEARTTMTAACAGAGLTERYFYESFGSRDEALVAALDTAASRIAETAVTAVAGSLGPPVDRVRAGLSAVLDLLGTYPALGRVVVLEATANPALRTRRRELLAWFGDIVAAESRTIYGERVWPPDRARLNAMAFVAGLAELVAAWLLDELDLTPERLVEIGTDLFAATAQRPDA